MQTRHPYLATIHAQDPHDPEESLIADARTETKEDALAYAGEQLHKLITGRAHTIRISHDQGSLVYRQSLIPTDTPPATPEQAHDELAAQSAGALQISPAAQPQARAPQTSTAQ